MNKTLTICIVLLLSGSTTTSPTGVSSEKSESSAQENDWCIKDYATVGVVGGALVVVAAPFALSWVGFTAGGVAAGSAAASIQSIVYGGTVASSSAFAALQSAGAAGLGFKATTGLFTAGVGAVTWLKSRFAPCDEGPECSSKKE